MADHVRKQIRTRVVGTTLAGLATTGSRVHDSLVYPLQTLPALRVGLEDEDIQMREIGPVSGRSLHRTVELVIEGCAKENATYEATLDAIQQEVEVAIANDNTLNGLVKSIVPMRVETERSGEADKPVAVRRMVFGVFYITAQGAPQTPL